MVLFITFWYKPLKADHLERYVPMPLDLSFFLPNKHPEKRITITNLLQTYYIYYYSIWKFLVLWVSLENKRLFFNLLFGCPKANFDLDVLNKKTVCLK